MPQNRPSRPDSKPSVTPGSGDAQVQGEGDYEAARRYREELKEYLEHSDVDERARVVMRDHARRFAAFFFAAVGRRAAVAARPLAERESVGRTSLAKRSMFASTARSSCTV